MSPWSASIAFSFYPIYILREDWVVLSRAWVHGSQLPLLPLCLIKLKRLYVLVESPFFSGKVEARLLLWERRQESLPVDISRHEACLHRRHPSCIWAGSRKESNKSFLSCSWVLPDALCIKRRLLLAFLWQWVWIFLLSHFSRFYPSLGNANLRTHIKFLIWVRCHVVWRRYALVVITITVALLEV